jgi:hypothetical protein
VVIYVVIALIRRLGFPLYRGRALRDVVIGAGEGGETFPINP